MATSPGSSGSDPNKSARDNFEALRTTLFKGKKVDGDPVAAAEAAGAFASPSQRSTKQVMLDAKAPCTIRGALHLNWRGYYNMLMDDYLATLPVGKDRIEFKKIRSCLRKRVSADFTTTETWSIFQFGKFVHDRLHRATTPSQESWLNAILHPEIASAGDAYKLQDINGVINAVRDVRTALETGKADKINVRDLALEFQHKDGWKKFGGALDNFSSIHSNDIPKIVNALETAKFHDVIKDVEKGSNRKSFVHQDEVLEIKALREAIVREDLFWGFLASSPNFINDPKDKSGEFGRWRNAPAQIRSRDESEVKRYRLDKDGRITQFLDEVTTDLKGKPLPKHPTWATDWVDALAQIRVRFWPSYELAINESATLVAKPDNVWMHLTNLHGLIRDATTLQPSQFASATAHGADVLARGIVGARASNHPWDRSDVNPTVWGVAVGIATSIVAGMIIFKLLGQISFPLILVAIVIGIIGGVAYEVAQRTWLNLKGAGYLVVFLIGLGIIIAAISFYSWNYSSQQYQTDQQTNNRPEVHQFDGAH